MIALAQSHPALRRATADDVEAIAEIWHRGWPDGHLGHVPPALRQHRGLDDFRRRVPPRLAGTIVATIDSRVVGFVMVHDDELEQLYVDPCARGGGAAGALLRQGEDMIAARFERGWLAVVPGNSRARRFYANHGWHDAGDFDYGAETASGTMPVVCRLYEKHMEKDS